MERAERAQETIEDEVLAPLARRHAWELFGLWWEGLAG